MVNNDFAGASGDIIIEIDGNIESTGDDAVRVRAGQSTGTVVITGAANLDGGPNVGNDGIDVINGGSIFVDLDGLITGDPGISISSILGGNLTVLGAGNVIGTPAEGILATTSNGDGNILIGRDGDVTGGDGIEARTSDSGTGTGDITINVLTGRTVTGVTGIGIDAQSDLGRIDIDVNGNVRSDGTMGIEATSGDGPIAITIHTGDLVESIDGTIGIFASTANGDMTTTGTVTIQGAGSVTGGTVGISAATDRDDILIQDLAKVEGMSGVGVTATSGGGHILIQNLADVDGSTSGMVLSAIGGAGAGNVTVNLGAGQTSKGETGDGISATTDDGTIDLNIDGIVASNGEHGVDLLSSDGAITVNIASGGQVEAIGGMIGVKANTSDGDMTTTGKITVQGEGSAIGGTHGIFLSSDNDDILVQNLGVVTGGGGTGITATSLGGDIVVQDISNVTGFTDGAVLSSIGGTGDGKVTVIVKDGTNISGGTGEGVDATTTDGDLEINVLGTISSASANAIKATSADGTIRINLGADGNVTANTGLGGILASTSNGDMTTTGTITVEGAGKVSGGTFGISASTDNDAILVQDLISLTGMAAEGLLAASLGGTIAVDDIATVSGATHGLSLASAGGNIAINEVGSVGGITGSSGDGVAAAAAGGNITFGTVTANGPVMGTVDGVDLSTTGTGGVTMIVDKDITGGTGYGIRATAGSGATDITVNAGVIISAVSDLAILFTSVAGTANSLLNNGTILGAVTGGDGDETFTNVSSDTWVPSGLDGGPSTSDFGTGTDAIINPGLIQVYDSAGPNMAAAEATVLGLESLTNSGIITMQNGEGNASLTTDRFSISSETAMAYIGDDGMLLVDSFLGIHPAPGDLLTLGLAGGTEGSTSGLTTIFVNDTDSGSPGVFNPIGVEVVRVESLVAGANTSSDHFVLDGGPIDKGLWIWDLGLDDTRANPGRATADVHVLYSRPSDIVMFTPYFGTGALTAFHASLEPWLDRQQTLEQSIKADSHRRTPGGNAAGSRRYIDLWLTPYGGRRSEDSASSLMFFGETLAESAI